MILNISFFEQSIYLTLKKCNYSAVLANEKVLMRLIDLDTHNVNQIMYSNMRDQIFTTIFKIDNLIIKNVIYYSRVQ